MKKIIALLLAVVMLMSFAACGGNNNATETTTEPAVEETTTEPAVEDTTAPDAEGGENTGDLSSGFTYFSLNYGENLDSVKYLTAMPNEDGTVNVDYQGQIRKMGDIDAAAVNTILTAFETSGLIALNGADVYAEGEASGSMYVDLGDGTSYTANYYGEVPEEFLTAYAAMDTCFQEITADLPEYVPQPMVSGEIAEGDKAALDALLANMTLDVPDAYMITGVAKDEYFAASVGLSSDEGVVSGVSFAPMMMSVAFGLNIVTVEDAANAETVAQNFVDNIDWLKWVCVQPGNALVAVKDNQVLCLLGDSDLYNQCVSAIEAAGWTTFQTLTNPNV